MFQTKDYETQSISIFEFYLFELLLYYFIFLFTIKQSKVLFSFQSNVILKLIVTFASKPKFP